MAKYKSIAELQRAMMPHVAQALQQTVDEAHKLVEEFILQYYTEFSPVQYERTLQLLTSCIKTDVITKGNSCSAKVYIDVSSLHYKDKGADSLKVVQSADNMLHGGYDAGTSTRIWQDPMDVLKGGQLRISFVEHMSAQGFNIRG